MKKRALWICMLWALAMLLVSCQGMKDMLRPDPKTADELWERIGESMQGTDAYALSMEMDMTMVVEGFAVTSTATGTLIEDKGEDYYYYTETNISVSCEALDVDEEMRSISAYSDGNAFEFRGEDGYERKLYSAMTREEYEAYRASDEKEETPDFKDCTTAEFAHNEDGTWTLTYSGYTKRTMGVILKTLDTETDVFGAEIVDMKVTFKTDESFCVTEIDFSFEFDVEEDATTKPVLDVCMKLTAMGDGVERVTDTINTAKYKKVDDLAICKQLEKMIKARTEAEQGEFEYKMNQTVKVMGQKETYSETDRVKFGTEEGKYFYDVVTEIDGEEATVTYKNGAQTVTYGGESYDTPQTEDEAKAFVASMINDHAMGYNAEQITNVKKKSEGVWEIELALADKTEFEALYEALGGAYKSATQTVTVTVQDGKLIRMKNVIDSKGSVMQGSDIYEITWTVQIETSFFD